MKKMVITDKHESIADPAKVKAELEKLFNPLTEETKEKMAVPPKGGKLPLWKDRHSKKDNFEGVRPYVIASDPEFQDLSDWYPRKELTESRCCIKLFNTQIRLLEQKGQQANTVRLMLFCYLHIIEADYPLALVYNAVSFSRGGTPMWKFPDLAGGKTEKEKAEERINLRHPAGKLEKIKILADKPYSSLLDQLERLFKSELRNAVAHSHFYVDQNGTVFLTGKYSPISRITKPGRIKGTSCIKYTREAIKRIYEGAYTYWECTEKNFHRYFESIDRMREQG